MFVNISSFVAWQALFRRFVSGQSDLIYINERNERNL